MKKCYIAGKIGDLPEHIYKENFNRGKSEVRAMGFVPVSPVDLPHRHNRTWCDYMKEDLIAMLECDSVYALRNWRESIGAKIEINLALEVGINIIQQPMKSVFEKTPQGDR